MPETRKYAFIITCKGRLTHLKQTLSTLMECTEGTPFGCVLVDYQCPDHCGDWAEATYPGRVAVRRVKKNHSLFDKNEAQNLGATYASAVIGAEVYCFVDADTLIAPTFLKEIEAVVLPRRFLVFAPKRVDRDLCGVLCVHQEDFHKSGGFDTNYIGWGGADLELRVRLYNQGCLFHALDPKHFAAAISHSDELRTQFFQEKNRRVSYQANKDRLFTKYEHLRHKTCVQVLLGVEAPSSNMYAEMYVDFLVKTAGRCMQRHDLNPDREARDQIMEGLASVLPGMLFGRDLPHIDKTVEEIVLKTVKQEMN